jgi:hypothetical protein
VPDVVRPARLRTEWSANRRFEVPTEHGSRGPAVTRPPVAAGPTLVTSPAGACPCRYPASRSAAGTARRLLEQAIHTLCKPADREGAQALLDRVSD